MTSQKIELVMLLFGKNNVKNGLLVKINLLVQIGWEI